MAGRAYKPRARARGWRAVGDPGVQPAKYRQTRTIPPSPAGQTGAQRRSPPARAGGFYVAKPTVQNHPGSRRGLVCADRYPHKKRGGEPGLPRSGGSR